ETTGQSISGLTVVLHCMEESNRVLSTDWDQNTDRNGDYVFCVAPGEKCCVAVGRTTYRSYDMSQLDKIPDHEPVARVQFHDMEPIVIDFQVPKPFRGTVLQADGKPAKGAYVTFQDTKKFGRFFESLTTDDDGRFVICKRPQNVVVQITRYLREGTEGYVGWFENDLPEDGSTVFRLRPHCQVKGRLLDAATGNPMDGDLISFDYAEAVLPKQHYMSYGQAVLTDKDGSFHFSFPVGARYDLICSPDGGKSISIDFPHIAVATVIPEKDGETIDLGEIKIDRTDVKPPWRSAEDLENEKRNQQSERMEALLAKYPQVQEEMKKVIKNCEEEIARGNKVLFLDGNISRPYHAEVMKCLKESEFSSRFYINAPPWEDWCPQELKDFIVKEQGGNAKVELVVADPQENFMLLKTIHFEQLRGEENSPWNVAADDPSNQGDWKKSPTGINPKILENFLRDCLEKNNAK
ncbi:MAG: carboxypeptidase-like regulatory domain-containing protein, partial [Planctomycetaceae bacterium]|nr:carboxypeptidase-like regulatory domain-containing protein [Planctomycetaceae bacterium]